MSRYKKNNYKWLMLIVFIVLAGAIICYGICYILSGYECVSIDGDTAIYDTEGIDTIIADVDTDDSSKSDVKGADTTNASTMSSNNAYDNNADNANSSATNDDALNANNSSINSAKTGAASVNNAYSTYDNTAESNTAENITDSDINTINSNSNSNSYIDSSGYFMDGNASIAISLVNEERIHNGLPALTVNYALTDACRIRAKEITKAFSHVRLDGSMFYTSINTSYYVCGENIAAGVPTANEVVASWLESDEHRENILDSSFTQMAIVCYYDEDSPYGYYWVQIFI